MLGFAACGHPTGDAALDSRGSKSQAMLADLDDGTNWPAYGRTFDESHYSPLADIDQGNVGQLGLVWYRDLPPAPSTVAAPLAIDGILYVASGFSIVRAIEAATGKQLWEYDPKVPEAAGDELKAAWGIRGLAWWDGRLFIGTQDGRLIAIDARTGRPAWTVKTTKRGDGRYITGAPRVFNGRVIIGHGGADFAPVRGYVTAYDTASGKQLWRFYTVPGNPAVDRDETTRMAARTWTGEWWKHGGGGTVWNAMTYDPEFDRIYIGTGNGAPWNQKIRSPGGGDNLFLCSIVALDAKTGRYVWHYQTVPGETWDMNSAMDIQLATLPIGGKDRPVLLHAPKNGFFYVIDRTDGRLLSAEPFEKVTWASKIDLKTGRPVENPAARLPQGQALIWPGGGAGAHNWYPMAYSPKQRLVYIPVIKMPGFYSDRTIDPATWAFRPRMSINSGFDPIIDFTNVVAPKQDLGALKAWDPVAQRERWSAPLAGAMNGGVMATAGNLVFQGQADGKVVARSAETGSALWRFDAQTGVLAQPITYRANGRQYVTIIAGYGGAAGGLGPLNERFGWDYHSQPRRILTFAIGGKTALPSPPLRTALQPTADPAFRPDAASARRGAILYANGCILCHGANVIAGGTAPDLRASAMITDAAAFAVVVRDGGLVANGMPKFDDLTDREREDIRHYLRARAHDSHRPEGKNHGAL